MKDYLTVTEAAAVLGMSERALRNRIERGDMQAERAGARILLIPRAEVERWQQIGRLKPGPKPRRADADKEHEE